MPLGPGYTRADKGLVLGDPQFAPKTVDETVRGVEANREAQHQLAQMLMGDGGDGNIAAAPSAPDLNALGRPSRSTGLRGFAEASRNPLGAIGLSMVPGGNIAGGAARAIDVNDFATAYGYKEPTFGQTVGSFFGGDYLGDVSQNTALDPNMNPYGATTASELSAALAAAGMGQGAQQAAIDRGFIAGDIGHPGMGRGAGVDFGGLDADIGAASDVGFGYG